MVESRGFLGKSRGSLGSNFFKTAYISAFQEICAPKYFKYFKEVAQINNAKQYMLKYSLKRTSDESFCYIFNAY